MRDIKELKNRLTKEASGVVIQISNKTGFKWKLKKMENISYLSKEKFIKMKSQFWKYMPPKIRAPTIVRKKY